MFNGIFNQFLDQTVKNPPKIVGGPNRKTETKPKNPLTVGGFGREIKIF
jgi:hypothetical protein